MKPSRPDHKAFGNDRRHHIVNVVVAVAIAASIFIILLIQSGMFDKPPTVTVVADNCYADTLHVITDEDYSPYSFYDENGKQSGYDVEMITLVANKLQMNLDLKFMDWNEAIASMVAGEADILMTCDYSDSFEGVDNLIKSEATSYDDFIVFSNHPVSSVNSLYGKKIAIMNNGNVSPQMELLGLSDYCIPYKDNREAMKALIDGKAEYAVMRQAVGATLLKELEHNKKTKAYFSAGISYMCYGMNNDEPELADRVNQAIEELKVSGDCERLTDKWLTTFVRPYTFFEVISHNLWVVFLLALFVLAAVAYIFRNKQREIRQKVTAARDAAVIAGLSDDFGCVVYVNTDTDHESHYRFDPLLAANIPGWETITNFSERMTALIDTVMHPDDIPYFRGGASMKQRILDTLDKDGVYYHNFRIVVSGETRFYQEKIIRDENSENHIIAGIRNVDETVRREMEYQEKLEAANKSKTDFLFNMSHDIRTPMNAIIGFTQLAKRHIDDKARVEDSLEKIESSGSHLLDLINEVLDMSRVEAGKLHSDMKTVNVLEAANRLVSICQETARQRNIDLSLQSKNIVHQVVIADELHINQIIMNILGNAVKYTGQGGKITYVVEEMVSEVPDYGKYIFTIEDTGIGMSEEFLKHIFDSFSREDNASTSSIQGTGLGMAIVKRLVDYMDGTINVESKQGEGTKVTVVLHMRLADADPAQNSSVGEEQMDLTGKKALLVEDNELNREIAEMLLIEQGIVVEKAVNGMDAVEHVKNRGVGYYDFVLMDVQMPMMDGFEATKEIRKLEGSESLPIIALSANAFEEDRRQSLAAGMNEHVAKPINIPDLMRVIAKLVK